MVWIRGLGASALTRSQRWMFYVALGRALGEPILQGDAWAGRAQRLLRLDDAIPVSMTSAVRGFCTDGAARAETPDVVGLFCERPDGRGGDVLISSARAAYRDLRVRAPEALGRLHRGYAWRADGRGAAAPEGQPIFSYGDGQRPLTFRYDRYAIASGQEQAGRPLTAPQRRALDLLDARFGVPVGWVEGASRDELFERFLEAAGMDPDRVRASGFCDAAEIWSGLFLQTCATGGGPQAIGALGLGAESVVGCVHSRLIEAIDAHLSVVPRDRAFFTLHATRGVAHERVLRRIAVELADTRHHRELLRRGMLMALNLQAAFFDAMLERALAMARAVPPTPRT